jgi:hypothetical protein
MGDIVFAPLIESRFALDGLFLPTGTRAFFL